MFSLKTTTLCHSVRSLRSPVFLSFQESEVARVKLTTRSPELSWLTFGSLPRLPIRMTLLTLPAMMLSLQTPCARCPRYDPRPAPKARLVRRASFDAPKARLARRASFDAPKARLVRRASFDAPKARLVRRASFDAL